MTSKPFSGLIPLLLIEMVLLCLPVCGTEGGAMSGWLRRLESVLLVAESGAADDYGLTFSVLHAMWAGLRFPRRRSRSLRPNSSQSALGMF